MQTAPLHCKRASIIEETHYCLHREYSGLKSDQAKWRSRLEHEGIELNYLVQQQKATYTKVARQLSGNLHFSKGYTDACKFLLQPIDKRVIVH